MGRAVFMEIQRGCFARYHPDRLLPVVELRLVEVDLVLGRAGR